MNNIAGSHVFSTLYLVKGYYQVKMFPDDIPKTAIITQFGLFEFVHMPFGLQNAGSTSQRLMDYILTGLLFIFVYLDDMLEQALTRPLINNIFVKCFMACKRTASPSTRRSPSSARRR